MSLKSAFRNLMIGKSSYIPSHGDYKTTILRGQLSLVMIGAAIIYLITDSINGIVGYEKFYFIGIAVAFLVFLLNRTGYYLTANTVFLLVFNAIIFVFATNDRHRAGTFLHFIIAAMVAVSFFGYRKRWLAIPFCLLSFGLFWAAYVWKVKLMPMSSTHANQFYNEGYVQSTLLINFSLSIAIAVLLLFFLSDVNNTSERALLKANDLLRKTNQELDRFVYSASHDLKAPLSSMLGLIEVGLRTDDPEEVKMCLHLMKSRVNNLDDFIKEIIDYSRNSRMDLKKEKINVLELVKDLLDSLRHAEGFENIYVKLDIPELMEVETDRARIRVVVSNLIANALKYHDSTKPNPSIDIMARADGGGWFMEIKDNGIGIAPEHEKKIFEMFYRASERSTGSGLGLYIVKETLEKISGKILVESTLGIGSSFKIALP